LWQASGNLALLCVLVSCAFIAVSAAGGPELIVSGSPVVGSWVYGLFRGLVPPLSATSFAIAWVVLALSYLVALATTTDTRLLWSVIVCANLLFLLAPPLLSSDVFGYIAYARLEAIHHLNPYLHPPLAAGQDPIVALVYWRHETSPYGPLFSALSYPAGLVSPPLSLWMFKGLAAITSTATSGVIWRTSQRLDKVTRNRATVLVGLSPVLLVYAVGGGHVDVAVMLCISCAVALLRTQAKSAGVWLLAACAMKLSAGLVFLFALAGPLRRARMLVATGVAAACSICLTIWIFGTSVVSETGSLVTGNRYLIDYSGPSLASQLLGLPTTDLARIGGAAMLAIATIVGVVRCMHGADWVCVAGWTTLVALLVVPTLAPWYVCWLLPLAALSSSRSLRLATLAFTALLVAAHLPLVGRPLAP
jgi:hypothetical protein